MWLDHDAPTKRNLELAVHGSQLRQHAGDVALVLPVAQTAGEVLFALRDGFEHRCRPEQRKVRKNAADLGDQPGIADPSGVGDRRLRRFAGHPIAAGDAMNKRDVAPGGSPVLMVRRLSFELRNQRLRDAQLRIAAAARLAAVQTDEQADQLAQRLQS